MAAGCAYLRATCFTMNSYLYLGTSIDIGASGEYMRASEESVPYHASLMRTDREKLDAKDPPTSE